jgi:uncharacterized protein
MVGLIACLPVGAWAATSLGHGVQLEQCSDAKFLFKLLFWGPIVEEIVFRAGLQRRLMGYFHNAWMANGITSVAFALIHYLLAGNLANLAVFIPSLAFGWLYQQTGKLHWAIALHVGFNLLFLLMMCAFHHNG